MIQEVQFYAGNYLEVDFIPFRKTRTHSRGPRTKPTSEAQKKLNQENCERELYMLIHENFTNEDYTLHPTYSNAYRPQTKEEALRDRRNFSLRCKRLYDKFQKEFKAVFVLEKTKTGKYHHHMIFSGGVPRDEIEKTWGMGICNVRGLKFSEHGIEGLSKYIVKSADDKNEADEKCTFKSYSHTRNLKKPAPPKRRAVSQKTFVNLWENYSSRDIFENRYKDYFFVEAVRTDNSEHGERYIRVKLCRKDTPLDYIEDNQYSGILNYRKNRYRRKNKSEIECNGIPPS